MLVYKIYLNRTPGYVVAKEDVSAALAEIYELEPGESIKIECLEMTKEVYENLPEFSGF